MFSQKVIIYLPIIFQISFETAENHKKICLLINSTTDAIRVTFILR